MENNKFGYMCGLAFQTDIDPSKAQPSRIYGSVEALKDAEECWHECGIVMVELREVGWVEEQELPCEKEN